MKFWVSVCLAVALSSVALSAQKAPNPVVVIETNVGVITIELYKNEAPRTVENFLSYVSSGFYGGTIFHRIVRGAMIQGGGVTPQLRVKPAKPPIKNEATDMLRNERGTVAAARLAAVDSATSQFFINTNRNYQFDHKSIRPDEFGYAVFGRVVEGMDVVNQIERVKTNSRGVPQSLVMISRAYLKE